MKRKIFCLLLACVLCLGMMPAAASSAGDEAKAAVTAAATVPQSEKRIYKAGTKNPYSSSETVFQPYEFLIDENSRVSANVSVPSANMSGSAVNGEETGEEEPPLDPYKVADVVLDFTDFPTVSEDGSTVSISGDGYIILDGNLIGKIVSSNCTGVFTLEGADYPVSVTLTGETIYITNLNFTIIDYSINENINVHPPLTTGQYNGTLTVAVTMYETFYIHSGQNNQTISFNATVVPPPIMENKAISVIWQDEDNYDQLRPTSIEAIYGGISANLTAPDWNGTITVPEGTAGDWSITKPEGYSCQFSSAGNTTVATLTHSVAPTVTVTAGVAWDDNGNATGAYPDSVSLQLLRDGQPYGDPVTAKAPDWKVTWENLRPYPPAAVSDKPYQYTVVQAEAPANYKLTRNENRILTYTYDPTYTAIWLDGDGKELDKKTYKEGEAEPTTDKVPTKDEDEDNTYAFDKWDGGTVSGTTKTYKPSFTATAKDKPEPAKTEYTVIWLNGDGSELDKKTYKEGEAEPATDKIPTKAEDAKNTYAFDKWDGGTVSGTVKTYKPIFTATAKPEAPKPAEPNWWYAPENPPAAQPGRVNRVTVDKGIYQLYENTGTAMLVGVMTEKIKDLVIPATVSANGRTYKVTEIDEKACQKLQKLKSVVFGKYIKVIGRKAFYQCAKLKTLTFQGKKLRFIGEKAFKGINKKAVATVPDGWYRPYKKLLRNAGYPENGEIGKEEPAE